MSVAALAAGAAAGAVLLVAGIGASIRVVDADSAIRDRPELAQTVKRGMTTDAAVPLRLAAAQRPTAQ